MPLSVTFGGRTLASVALDVEKAGRMDETDMLYILNRQKTRILERTARGVDINGSPFAPYSTKGPFYYYPARGLGGRQRKAAAGRKARQLGGQRTRLGVKFASYAAFKAGLGRGVVDLLGPTAPHMLQAIVVAARGADNGILGIYGSEADRAEGHNTGFGHLPKREFFGFGASDEAAIQTDLDSIIGARLEKIL